MWRQKNKKNSLGANRFIKEEADAATKAKPNKVEKEKLETEKAAPSKVMTTSERLLVGGSKTPPDTAPRLPPKPVKEQCLVLFPYTAQNEDELTLEEGQTIQIISREVEDKGWWKGEVDGRTGVFPDNFVKLLVEEDKRDRKPSRPPPVAQEVEKSLLGKPLGNSVKRLSDDIKAALSSENLSRSPGSSEKLRGSDEKLISRFDGRSSEKRKSRRSGEESGSGDRLISGSSSRKNSSNTKTSLIGTTSNVKTPSSIGSSSKMLQGNSAASSPPKSSSAALANASKSSAAPTGPSVAQKKDISDSSRLEVRAQRLDAGDSDPKERRLSEPPTKRLDTPGHEATGLVDLSQSAPLSHPTAGRVKAPKRRPPSQHFLKENIPDVETMEASPPDSTETPDLASKSKSSTVEGVASQKPREGEILKGKLPVTASQVLPSAQESSPASEAKPSWLEELSRKQANRRSGVFPEKQQPPVKPADQEQAFRRSGGSVQEEASRRSLVGGGTGFPEKPGSKPEPPLAENKPNLPSRPSQVKAEEGNRKSLSSSLASSASSIINSKKTSGREQENTKPTDLAKSDKAPQRPTLPAPLSKTPSAPSIPSPSASVGAKKELGRRESERESEEKKRRVAGEKQEEESRSSKRSDSQLSRNPSDSSSSKNASTASVHSTNLGKPAPNLSFVARPEKPTVVVATEEKVRGSKEDEKKASEGGGGGSSIGWSSEVLRGRASGAERVESTNTEYTNGTEAKESQEVADLKASVMSMQTEFNLQLSALRRELEEERMARTRLEQEVRSLKKLASK